VKTSSITDATRPKKFICIIANVPQKRDLKLVFLPRYCVSTSLRAFWHTASAPPCFATKILRFKSRFWGTLAIERAYDFMDKISSYLQRIGYKGHPRPDFDTLHALQRLHLQAVPYENLDIVRGIPISLEVEDIYDKIVNKRRGGYCFELNALFAWLLRSIGFNVTDYMARFLKDEPEIPMRRHRVLKVSCVDGDYLSDVGVGLVVPKKPIPLIIGKVNRQNGEKYIIEKEDFLGNVLYEWRNDIWRKLYAFTEEPQLEKDFIAVSFYCEKHPDSIFNVHDMVHIFTDKGRKSIANREVRLYREEGVEILQPVTEAAYHDLLFMHFGICL